MKFGLFYEMQLPRPWRERDELDLVQNALEQVELADGLGIDFAWTVEHHFLEEYSHCSAPEVFLAAASQRTRQIRLAHGIIQLTTNSPARVAERVAMLDLVSRGRVELGVGEGATTTELHPFGRRYRDKRAAFEEAVAALIPMLTQSSFEYHGEFVDFPLRNVVPKPMQKPHPPLWMACSQIESIERAGHWGLGALAFQFVSASDAYRWVNAYYSAYTGELERLADYTPNPGLALVSPFMCAETDEEARRRSEGWSFFQFALGEYGKHPFPPGSRDLWKEYQDWRQSPKGRRLGGNGLIGSPETIRRRLRRFEGSRIDQVILLNQAGDNRHEDICESLELFAREVMPEFHERDAAHLQWKAEILAGERPLPPAEPPASD